MKDCSGSRAFLSFQGSKEQKHLIMVKGQKYFLLYLPVVMSQIRIGQKISCFAQNVSKIESSPSKKQYIFQHHWQNFTIQQKNYSIYFLSRYELHNFPYFMYNALMILWENVCLLKFALTVLALLGEIKKYMNFMKWLWL